MNVLSLIISTFSSKEKVEFLNFLKKRNKRNDIKNIELFRLLERMPNSTNYDKQLYGRESKGAYHALSKRLHDSLIDFIAIKSFKEEGSKEASVIKLHMVAEGFLKQRAYKIGFKTLRKAELMAKKFDLFSLLNEVLYTKIQYAHFGSEIVLEDVLNEFQENKSLAEQEETLNLFYASFQNNLLKNYDSLQRVLENSLIKFKLKVDNNITYRSLFKILDITNEVANLSRDFKSVFSFIVNNYKILRSKETDDKQLYYEIQIIYYVANAYFRNRDFDKSQYYLSIMEERMLNQQNKYLNRFTPQFTLLRSLNLNYSDKPEIAINLVENFDFEKYNNEDLYTLDLKLCLVMFYVQQVRLNNALATFRELNHSDKWYSSKSSLLWVIKKNLLEIVLYIELDYIDLVESRTKSFQKKHMSYLKEKKAFDVINFFKLVKELNKYPERKSNSNFMAKFKDLHNSIDIGDGDIFTISFYAWLKAKLDNADLYKTTLSCMSPV